MELPRDRVHRNPIERRRLAGLAWHRAIPQRLCDHGKRQRVYKACQFVRIKGRNHGRRIAPLGSRESRSDCGCSGHG
jgi:hypothetical protein